MSKKYNNKPSWKNKYNEHDIRAVNQQSNKNSFKNRGGKHIKKDWSASIKAHLLDEDIDIDMGSIGSSSTYTRGNKNWKKRGNRSGYRNEGERKLFESPTNWYRVFLPYGNKYNKRELQQTIKDKLNPLPFAPIAWSINGSAVTFYIDDFKVAEKIFGMDRSFQMSDGFSFVVRVNGGAPNMDLNNDMKEKMKLCMAKRYNAVTKALDLTKFHSDPDLQDYFCALYKPVVMLGVIDIISENIPELEALNIQDNRIHVLTFLKEPIKKLRCLKILYIGNNKLRDISALDALVGLPLVELVLEGNPLCDKFKDTTVYISEVRSRFNKILRLDGKDLPPPIGFDISAEDHKLPTSLQTFLCNNEGGVIVRQFLQQYFELFDSENRQMLMQAYHQDALFSLTCHHTYGQKEKAQNLHWYASDNRNLFRVMDPERRSKLLKQGNLAIIAYLKDMPRTAHDILGFSVDLTVFTPQMLVLTIQGMYKEVKSDHRNVPIRSFFRTLVIVPNGSGFCIANEVMHVSNATSEQARMFKATRVPVVPAAPIAPVVPAPEVSLNNSIDDSMKQQMVEAMATRSGMNIEWSSKCLQETGWDFERATLIFDQLQKAGQVPPEAFIK